MRMRGGSPGGQGGFLVSAYASYVFLFLIEGLSDLMVSLLSRGGLVRLFFFFFPIIIRKKKRKN